MISKGAGNGTSNGTSGNGARRGAFDWDRVRAALVRAAEAIDTAHTPSGEAAARILATRARRLAQPVAATEARGQLAMARFQLGAEHYALELPYLREVAQLTSITPVPGAPDFVMGVTNLRGEILSVFDLRKLLGVKPTGLSDMARLLVLGRERAELGILADAVSEVALLDPGALAPPPETVSARGRRYLRGVTRDALIALDGAALLDDEELVLQAAEDSEVAHDA
jgi:purine-binding chemotaxis protein CheW